MCRASIRLVVAVSVVFLFYGFAHAAQQVGEMPVPTLKNVKATVAVTYNADRELYIYNYTVSNGSASTGEISGVNIDMATPRGYAIGDKGLMIPLGAVTESFHQVWNESKPFILPPGYVVVPFGQSVPSEWAGDLTRDGFAQFGAGTEAAQVSPGDSISGLKLLSPTVPVIRDMIVEPWWVPVFSGEVSKSVAAKAGQVQRDILVHLQTLAPSGARALPWSTFEKQVKHAIKLGWIPDSNLAQRIQNQINDANAAVTDSDGTRAKQILQQLLDTLSGASDDAIRIEARELIKFNTQALIQHTSDTPIPVTPKFSLTPLESAHHLGQQAMLVAHAVNSSNHDKPLPGHPMRIVIVDGPDQGLRRRGYSNGDGKLIFNYTGHALGTDIVQLLPPLLSIAAPPAKAVTKLQAPPRSANVLAEARVHWTGGADLVVPLFVPPVIKAKGGIDIKLKDWTKNRGDIPAKPTITRFYLSKDKTLDPETDIALAIRHVPALDPGEVSRGNPVSATLPEDLSIGVYHLFACADANHHIVETNEANNCSYSTLKHTISIVAPVVTSPNAPPNCSDASPTQRLLWPPNHKWRHVSITHVTDPDGDNVTLTITAIKQDEPVNGVGDGNTAPDGAGIGSAYARVRAERSGAGSGRLYFIHFRGEDAKGGSCTGAVTVGVPHDRSRHGLPKDTGGRYDSTDS